MSMLEKMARRLALDALERVQPDTFTNVIDTIDLTKNEDGNYQVGERISYGDKNAPWLDYDAARDTMVAMMAAQAGAIVVVPEDAPMGSHLAHIAKLLVDSGDVPTDASDVADGAAIVGTVKRALDWLTTARTNNRRLESANISLSDSFENISAMLVKSPDIALGKDDLQTVEAVEGGVGRALRYLGEVRREAAELRVKVERLEVFAKNDADLAANRLQEASAENDRIREQYLAAQQEIGALTVKLEAAQRTNVSYSGQLEGWQGRYEGLSEALSMALDKLAEVRK